jgi:tetraacyldisaccharide 4'-kinase
MDRLRARAGRLLEAGVEPSAIGRAAASLWEIAAARGVRRPLDLPEGLRVVGVGGAVLGGAGKSPVAVAIARELARRGERAALVSHAYRASPGSPRRVRRTDDPREVGDDALASARLLDADGVPVIVGPSRRAALDFAIEGGASIAVVDGLLQAAPAPLTDSILVLDAIAPWGSRRCPPLGDLRASPEALLLAADHVAVVTPAVSPSSAPGLPQGSIHLPSSLAGAFDAAGRPVDLAALKGRAVGLIVAVARPERIRRALAVHGIDPAVVLELADHAALTPADRDRARSSALASARRLDHQHRARCPRPPEIWLTTARCATKLPPELWGAPVLALDHRVEVGPLLCRLRAASSFRTPPPVC